MMIRIGLWVVAAALAALSWLWLGGSTTPITAEETAAYLTLIGERQRGQSPPSAFRANIEAWAAKDDGRAFFMLNLETLAEGEEASAADEAYARALMPLLLARGSFPMFLGTRQGLAFGEAGATIDRVAMVRYRSLRDFLDFVADERMGPASRHKWASLQHTEVFPVGSPLATWPFRLLALAFIALIALVLDRIVARR